MTKLLFNIKIYLSLDIEALLLAKETFFGRTPPATAPFICGFSRGIIVDTPGAYTTWLCWKWGFTTPAEIVPLFSCCWCGCPRSPVLGGLMISSIVSTRLIRCCFSSISFDPGSIYTVTNPPTVQSRLGQTIWPAGVEWPQLINELGTDTNHNSRWNTWPIFEFH